MKFVLLGLLGRHNRHGYELRTAFEELTAGTWPINEGQIYATLSRLERDGLVSSTVVEQALLPNRRVYELTPAGQLALKRWLAEPAEEPVRLKDDWFVKVLVQALVAPDRWAELLGSQREAALRRLADLEEACRDPDTPVLAELVLEGAMYQVEAGLRWLDACEDRLANLVRLEEER